MTAQQLKFDVLRNPFVQYLVLLVAIGNFFLFVYSENIASIVVFLVSAVLAAFYSKNMVVILVVAMVVCNIVCVGTGNQEGFYSTQKPTLPSWIQAGFDDLKSTKDKTDLLKPIQDDIGKIKESIGLISQKMDAPGQ